VGRQDSQNGPARGSARVGRATVPAPEPAPRTPGPGGSVGRATVPAPEPPPRMPGPGGGSVGRAATPAVPDPVRAGPPSALPGPTPGPAPALPARPTAAAPDRPAAVASGSPAGVAAVPAGGSAAGGPPAGAGSAPAGRSARRTVVVCALVVLIITLAGVGTLLVARPGLFAGRPAAEPSAAPEPAPSPVLQAVGGDAPAPTPAGVRAAIAPLLKDPALGPRVNVSIVDVSAGTPLLQQNADTMTTPASTTKLLTAVAVLAARGPAYRLTTRAVAGASPGDVVLVGGGDPTLAVNRTGLFPGAARLDVLAGQVRRALGATRPTRVVLDTSLYGGPDTAVGWEPGDIAPAGQVARIQPVMTDGGRIRPVHHEVGADPRFADPALAAAKAFARQLGVATVTRGKAPAPAAAGGVAPGAELGRVQSPPLVQVVDWMLQWSDNVIAEALGRQVALAAGRPATFEGATEALAAKLAALNLPSDELDLYDTSGLSRHDGISPALLTGALALAASGRRPGLGELFGGLPVAGWSGTLQDRFATPAPNRVGQGLVRAKTGTLTGVNTMSGELVTRDGRLLVFAVLADRTGGPVAARAALDRIAARLVTCGCG
jgi:serine-type D-Ala-D-Ala carboxypeptidase/endopeptidase (penicillin-binding protein 4)